MDRITELERRLASLEADCGHAQRTARRARSLAGGAIALLAGGVLIAAAAPGAVNGVLKLKRLEIIDDEGHLVFAASSDARGGRLDLWSASGANVVRAGANEHGGDLNMWNDDGTTVYAAYATDAGGALGVWNTDSEQAVVFARADERGGRLEVRNDIGATVLDLATGETRAGRLTVAGADATPRFTVDTKGDDATNVAVLDGLGQERLHAVARSGGGALTVHDDLGHAAVTADATAATGRLTVANGAGHRIFDVRSNGAGDGAVAVLDAGGAERVRLDVESVSVRDNAGIALVAIESDGGLDVATGRVVVRDQAGIERLELGADAVVLRDRAGAPLLDAGGDVANGGRIALHGPSGGQRLRLGAGSVAVRNDTGATVVEIGGGTAGGFVDVSTSGSRVATIRADTDGGGRIDLSNAAGERVFSADVIDDGAALALRTNKGRNGLLMAARSDGALMNLFNRREVPVIAIDAEDGPGGAISILNQRGTPVVLLEADTEDRGLVRVYDAKQTRTRSMAVSPGRTSQLARED